MRNQEETKAMQEIEDAVAKLSPELREIASRLEAPTLHSACAAGEIDLVRALLDIGLAPDMYPCIDEEDDEPPLTWIARYRDIESTSALTVAELLIARGAGVDEGMPLLAATEAEDLSMIRLLLAAGADPELILQEAGLQQRKLLESVITLGWHRQPYSRSEYHIAFNDDQQILAVGDTEEGARRASLAKSDGDTVHFMRATERLVARFLSREELCWEGSGLADLEAQ